LVSTFGANGKFFPVSRSAGAPSLCVRRWAPVS
jgi:hypothetical protein